MARVDTNALLSRVNITDVITPHIGALKKRGNELYGVCPFHGDSDPSLQVNEEKQIFKCFACGAGGDAIAFLMELGYTFHEAVAEIEGEKVQASGEAKQRVVNKPESKPQWKQIKPTAEDCNRVQFHHYRHGDASKVWKYTNAAGATIGYVCRFDLGDGEKEVLPLIFATNGKFSEWRWQGFDKPRPLYGLDRLAAEPDKTVILVEGEKTADAVQKHINTGVVVAWPGGSRAIEYIDWTPLHGRKVILWPDNDQPGDSAMLHVAQFLAPHVALLKWVQNEEGLPKGWDGADRDWQGNDARNYAMQNLRHELPAPLSEVPAFLVRHGRTPTTVWKHTPREQDEATHYSARYDVSDGFEWRFVKEPSQAPEPEPTPAPEPSKPLGPEPPPATPEPPAYGNESDNGGIDQDYFSFLGYSRGDGTAVYHFFSNKKKIIVSLSPSSMSKSNLMELAPLQWWEHNFPGRSGMSVEAAVNWLINTSSEKGMFSDKAIRGRGAWIDKGRVVLHEGDYLIVDGNPVSMGEFQSRYIYERGEPLGFQTENPLTTEEANKLMDVFTLLNWEREIDAYLLAGWCIVAPICGALNWRPHIWLTGAAGTGKSWLFKNLVRRLLGETSLAVQGETSEAGLRQILQHDALPVVFDEAEGEDRKAQERMQSVLSLMRAASADDGGIMAKGTSSGAAKTYRIRSCFAFASIAVQVAQQSDRTRVSVMGLKAIPKGDPERERRWKELQAKYAETITDDFVARLQARTVSLIPVILDNAHVFAAAGAAEIGEQRTGDQLGAMLAGAYSLFSSNRITYQKAVEWIKARDWSEEKGLDRTRDEVALLAFLLEQMTTAESASGHRYDRSVGELVSFADGRTSDPLISSETANERLKRLGLKVENGSLFVSNTAEWIKRTLANTAWAKNHNKILQRLDKSEAVDPTRFGPGPSARAVRVPLSVVFEDVK
jgi:putative DNA primase/helicase